MAFIWLYVNIYLNLLNNDNFNYWHCYDKVYMFKASLWNHSRCVVRQQHKRQAVVNVAPQKCIMFGATILPGPCFPTHLIYTCTDWIKLFHFKSWRVTNMYNCYPFWLHSYSQNHAQCIKMEKKRKRIFVTLVGHYINSIYYILWWFKQMSVTYQTQIDFSLLCRLMYR